MRPSPLVALDPAVVAKMPPAHQAWYRVMMEGDHAAAQEIEAGMHPFSRELLSIFHIPGILDETPPPEAIEEMGRRKGRAFRIMGSQITATRPAREASPPA